MLSIAYFVKVFIKVVWMGKLTSIVIPLRSYGFNCLYRYSIPNKRDFFSCLAYVILKVKQVKTEKGHSSLE